MGKIVCTINEPNVTQHESLYSKIVFAPHDIVDVAADGCVQTGGLGDTWKRYVNPIGPGLYHGLIRIPTEQTTKGALVRIKSVIGTHLHVAGVGVPESQLLLHLGYEDDDYSDNGYYSHDDGTGDQCKTDAARGIDGGPAHVTITIYRGVNPDPTSSRFDFDVLSDNLPDPNGLPFNPQWSWQLRPENKDKIPSTSLCHDFSARPTVLDIPQPYMAPNFTDCTDQADSTTVDLPTGINDVLCHIIKIPYFDDTFSGHLNWFPVTVEGHAGWGDHGADDDYTFTFTFADAQCDKTNNKFAGNRLSVNDRCGLHVEFDSDETIDNYTEVDEWTALHQAVDTWKDAKANAAACAATGPTRCTNLAQLQEMAAAAKEAVKTRFDGHTILTGMFGLDGEHDMKAEVHPLFAMSTLRDKFENDPSDEVWLMFARNQGDEGFCSSQIWGAGFEDYTVRLPWHSGMTDVDVNWDKTKFVGTDGTAGPTVAVLPPPSPEAGVYITFHLGPPVHSTYVFDPSASVPFIYGALHLIWRAARPPVAQDRTRVSVAVPEEEEADEAEHKIEAALDQLPPPQRRHVEKSRVIVGSRAAAVHQLPPVVPVRRLTEPPAIARIAGLHGIKVGPAAQKAERDAAQMRALCTATRNAPMGLPGNVVCRSKARHP
jgi:hypothetical protein